ncbi:hypothetical protein [Runella sp.]|uniref:hypothetical protein n=1 Tax=Runella sp. TaxID=1960881 RepID=UPI00301AD601
MRTLIALLFSYCLLSQYHVSSNYRATYHLLYHPDSTNLQRNASETFFLYMKGDGISFWASENSFKSDSIKKLMKTGVLSVSDVMGDSKNRFKTNFRQFIYNANLGLENIMKL